MGRRVSLNHGARPAIALLAFGILACAECGGARAEDAGGPAKACVTDIDKVIAAKPTGAMMTAALPAEIVAKLDEAARLSFKEAAAPGAIVGVRTPAGTWTAAYGKADPDRRNADAGRHAHAHRFGHQDLHRYAHHAACRGRQAVAGRSDRKVRSRRSERQPDKSPHACRYDERRRQLHPEHQVHRHLLRQARDDLHAGPTPRRRHRRIARLRARHSLRLLEHQHDPARDGHRKGHRATSRRRLQEDDIRSAWSRRHVVAGRVDRDPGTLRPGLHASG